MKMTEMLAQVGYSHVELNLSGTSLNSVNSGMPVKIQLKFISVG